MDEVQDSVDPHPERASTWTKFFQIAVTSELQRVFLTGTFPPHLSDRFLSVANAEIDTTVIRASSDRPELGYHVVKMNWKTNVTRNLMALVTALERELEERDRIIVFFLNSEDCEAFANRYRCSKYHSKLPIYSDECKEANLQRWDSGETKVMAATTAASVGVDRPYVKFTVVAEGTYGLLTFAQEVGRGGRRGEPSHSIVLHNDRSHKVHKFSGLEDPKDVGCLAAMNAYSHNRSTCRRSFILKSLDGGDRNRTCLRLPGSNPCDVCKPDGDIARLVKTAVEQAHIKDAISLGPPIQASFVSTLSMHPTIHPAPPPVPGPSKPTAQQSQESYFDEPTPSMLKEFDVIDELHKV